MSAALVSRASGVEAPEDVGFAFVFADRPMHRRPHRRRVGVRAVVAVLVGGLTVLVAPLAGAQSGHRSGGLPSGGTDAQGEPADSVPRGELDELGLLLMGRYGEMPEVKPPEFFDGPPDPAKPSGPPYKTGPNEASPVVIPPPALGAGDGTIFAEGDSVLLGTENVLPRTTAGWDLRMDARVGRTFPEGIASLRANRASIGQVLVVCLGHNYGGGGHAGRYIDEVMALASNAQRVVFVTQAEWSPPQIEVNREIYAAAQRHPKIVVAPWSETLKANPDFLADHVHPNASGRIALANLIAIMVGPVPPSDGNPKPPRPVILPIPTSPPTTSTTRSTTTTTSSPPPTSVPTSGGTSTTAPPTTDTTAPPTSDTTQAPTSTSQPPP